MKKLSLRFKLYALVITLLLVMGISIVVTAQLSLGQMEQRITSETRDTVRSLAVDRLSATAGKYGEVVSGPRVVDDNSRKQMKAVLEDIQDGTFARNWIAENEAGMPEFRRMMQADLEHPIEKVGAELRSRMDWLEE